MKKLLACLALLPLAALAMTGTTDLLPARVDQAIHARIDAGEYPALVVAVVEGAHSHVYAYGKLADGKTPDAHTVFEIGSVTKTFTATVLAQAVHAGALKLDTPVADLLPGFHVPARNGKHITLGNLATQHSGLPRLPSNIDPADPRDPYADYGGDRLRAFLAHYTLPRDPGSAYEYSNLGVGLLGYALAHHAGMSYAELVDKRIFAPLGMRASSVHLDAATRRHLAHGHDMTGKPVSNWNFEALAGAGAIKSDAADMLRYLRANMGQLKSSLYPAMAMAHRPRADVGPDERIGLVWMTRHGADGDVIWHNGMTGGYASFIGFRADGSRGVVILTNAQQSVDDLGFATLLPDAKLAAAHRRIDLPAATLKQYVGSYRLAPGFLLHVFRDKDQLYAQATGQGAIPLFASARDEFFASVGDIRVSFQRDKNGKVNGLILHQNGDHPAPRLSAAEADAAGGQRAIALKPSVLADYVGRYRLNAAMAFDITLDGDQLKVRLTGQSAYPIYPSARDRFFYRVVDAQIEFQRGKDGKVDALVLHQNGIDQRAPRIVPAATGGHSPPSAHR